MILRARQITSFRTDDDASNQFQEHVKAVLNPVLKSLGASLTWTSNIDGAKRMASFKYVTSSPTAILSSSSSTTLNASKTRPSMRP